MTLHYRLDHTTRFRYGSPVSVCHNTLCLTPRSGPHQSVRAPRLVIRPKPTTTVKRTDAFGNVVHAFSIETAHESLEIRARSRVSVDPVELPTTTPAWDAVATGVQAQTDPRWLEAVPFVFDSPLVRRRESVRAYAADLFPAGRPVLEAALEFNTRIHSDFEYKSGATQVNTHSDQAFEIRRGVCQDFAHVAIAALRSLGLPTRYVSGYLRTHPPAGQPRLVGADESHAWFAVYTGPEHGWIELDPTNDCLASSDHIRLARGRDYTDVAPVRGLFLGGGQSTLTVSVDVEPDHRPQP